MEQNLQWLLKVGGPLGFVVALLLTYYWRVVLPEQRKTREEYKAALESIVADARSDRDYARQQREREVDKFIESLRFRDQEFSKVAEAISERRQPRQR